MGPANEVLCFTFKVPVGKIKAILQAGDVPMTMTLLIRLLWWVNFPGHVIFKCDGSSVKM